MYYQIQKGDRPVILDTDHPLSVPNHKRNKKTDQQKIIIHTFTVIYMHQLNDQQGTSVDWIHYEDRSWLDFRPADFRPADKHIRRATII